MGMDLLSKTKDEIPLRSFAWKILFLLTLEIYSQKWILFQLGWLEFRFAINVENEEPHRAFL